MTLELDARPARTVVDPGVGLGVVYGEYRLTVCGLHFDRFGYVTENQSRIESAA